MSPARRPRKEGLVDLPLQRELLEPEAASGIGDSQQRSLFEGDEDGAEAGVENPEAGAEAEVAPEPDTEVAPAPAVTGRAAWPGDGEPMTGVVAEHEAMPEGDGEEAVSHEAPIRLEPAGFVRRTLGGVADLVVHAGVTAGGLTAMALLGLEPHPSDWPGLLGFVIAFSFLYTVVPLAFWGQTPGMAWSRTKAVDMGDIGRRPLTFGQTAIRWLASLVTVVLLGVPALVALSGRSLADRLSGSQTLQEP